MTQTPESPSATIRRAAWEYRVHTIATISSDERMSHYLGDVAAPGPGACDGWEIFTVLPAHAGLRLFMKRQVAAAEGRPGEAIP